MSSQDPIALTFNGPHKTWWYGNSAIAVLVRKSVKLSSREVFVLKILLASLLSCMSESVLACAPAPSCYLSESKDYLRTVCRQDAVRGLDPAVYEEPKSIPAYVRACRNLGIIVKAKSISGADDGNRLLRISPGGGKLYSKPPLLGTCRLESGERLTCTPLGYGSVQHEVCRLLVRSESGRLPVQVETRRGCAIL
jgi:hypothetical protein